MTADLYLRLVHILVGQEDQAAPGVVRQRVRTRRGEIQHDLSCSMVKSEIFCDLGVCQHARSHQHSQRSSAITTSSNVSPRERPDIPAHSG